MIYVDNDSTYSQRIYIPRNDDFYGATGHTITLQSKDYTINQNGLTKIHPDAGFDGISGGTIGVYVSAATGVTFKNLDVTENGRYVATGDTVYTGVTVNVNNYEEGYHDGFEAGYSSGYTEGSSNGYDSGYTEGYASGYTSGSTDGFASGYTSGTTDGYSSGYTEGFEAGYSSGRTDGIEYQKSLLTGFTANTNGVYTSETGYSGVTVNLNLVPLQITANTNDVYWWRASEIPGTEGADVVKVTVDVDLTEAYNSGVTYGVESVKSGFAELTASTLNSRFVNESGWSAVTVDIPTMVLEESIQNNGRYTFKPEDYNIQAFDRVVLNIDVTGSTPAVLTGLTATTNNQTYTPTSGVDGFNSVEVAIPILNGVSAGISSEGVYTFKASDYGNYEGIKEVEVTVDTTQAFNSGYTSGVTEGRIETSVHACRATFKITSANTTATLYYSQNIYGKPVNVINVHINELDENVSASTYTFASAGTYTLEYYTNGAPRFAMQSTSVTDVHITCDAIDQLILGTPSNMNLTGITFDNNTNIIYIPYSFVADSNTYISLPTITLPNSVRDIGSRAFENCDITSVVIGENVVSVGYKAFYANHNLTTIRSRSITTPDLGAMVFDQVASTGTLYVPTGSDYSSWMTALPSGWTKVYY